MTHYDWNSLPAEQLNPRITRRAVHTQNLTIARLEILKDAVVPEHSHVHEQVATVERRFPEEWIDGNGTGVTEDFLDYARPLIGGALPDFARFV